MQSAFRGQQSPFTGRTRSLGAVICRTTITDEVGAAVEDMIVRLAAAGAAVIEFDVPELAYGLGAIYAIELASSTNYHNGLLQAGKVAGFTPDVRLLVEMGRLVSAPDYLQAERFRRRLGERFAEVFDQVDVVVGPTMPLTAWRTGQSEIAIGGKAESVVAVGWRLTYPWNLLGLPALTLPCARDRDGLPIGLQIAGAAFGEAAVLRCAAACEQLSGGPLPRLNPIQRTGPPSDKGPSIGEVGTGRD